MDNARFQYTHVSMRRDDKTYIHSQVSEHLPNGAVRTARSMLGNDHKSYKPLDTVSAYHSQGQTPQFFHYEAAARCKFYFF